MVEVKSFVVQLQFIEGNPAPQASAQRGRETAEQLVKHRDDQARVAVRYSLRACNLPCEKEYM